MHVNRTNLRASGFTLVEILIVVVILGILAAIVVPQFTNAANEARGGNVQTQQTTLETQLELWAARNNGNYPDLATDGWGDVATALTMIGEGYIKAAPRNPFTQAPADPTAVTNVAMADPPAADAEADAGDGSRGWIYDQSNGLIRADGWDADGDGA